MRIVDNKKSGFGSYIHVKKCVHAKKELQIVFLSVKTEVWFEDHRSPRVGGGC